MTQPTPQQARALDALRNNRDVVDYLQACLDDLKNRLVTVVDAEAARVMQGQAQAYQQILNQIEGKPSSGKR